MILTYNITNNPGRLFVGFIIVVVQVLHGKKYPPVNRLETVPDIGQRPPHNYAHGIIEIGGLHLIFDINRKLVFVLIHSNLL